MACPPVTDPYSVALPLLSQDATRVAKCDTSLLPRYDRPGNVRELENAIERAVLLETTEVLQARNLPPRLSPIVASRRGLATPAAILPLAEVERRALAHELEIPANNVTEAARSLGLNRATLYRRLKKYGLSAGN